MFQRKPRRFRRHSNGRGQPSHGNGYGHGRPRPGSFLNSQTRNNFRTGESAEKLLEKYNNLAKEALSLGNETSCENYLQHADHYMRIIEEKNKYQNQNKTDVEEKLKTSSAETQPIKNISEVKDQKTEEKK